MRWAALLLATGLLSQTGCLLARNVAHNLANESAEQWDERKLSRKLRAEARDAWAAFCLQGGAYSADFADGFRDGYADHLESGGNACPPAVPPLRYRRSGYLSPEGHARVQDYFTGFKTGLAAAVASGRRQYLTVPVLVSDAPPPGSPPGTQLPAALRVGEQLPTPRRMDATTGLPIPDRPLAESIPPPPLPAVEKAPDPPTPPAPQSSSDPTPTVTPAKAEGRPLPEEPIYRRKSPPPEELPGRRVRR